MGGWLYQEKQSKRGTTVYVRSEYMIATQFRTLDSVALVFTTNELSPGRESVNNAYFEPSRCICLSSFTPMCH